MCVSGKSRGRLTATVEATTSNNEQSVNKETADIFFVLLLRSDRWLAIARNQKLSQCGDAGFI